ncbi:plasminogen-like [Gigantopelta aegis]|uniref:plasminogen-like n=1 Tax=Gigantopelta aegis TaxID=1735272 RepID=UPI001B889E2D|nr:plasminogen-like [Gigantopelta aegis]
MGNVTETLLEAGNSCRPSPGHPPWCYTTDPDITFDYCNIPLCDDFLCGDPPEVHNANIAAYDQLNNQYKYGCVTGTKYVKGSTFSKCRDDLRWDVPTIVCASLNCYEYSGEHGILYSGNKSTTSSGKKCQRWTVDTPHVVDAIFRDENNLTSDVTLDDASNYCRGFRDGKHPWCYTTDPSVVTETCDVPQCDICKKPPDLVDAIPSDRPDNETVIYRCKDGFNFIRGSGKSRCLKSGLWSIPDMLCARKYYADPYALRWGGGGEEGEYPSIKA